VSRDYAKIAPQFWTGETGKWLRKQGSDCQVVAFYLMTCPNANMIGLYYLPLPTLCHETGLNKQGASKALARLSEGGFAVFDTGREEVWVPEMAKYQIGETLKANDKQVMGIERLALTMRKSRFFSRFVDKYAAVYHLSDELKQEALRSPFQDPSKALRSQEQDQEQEQEQEQDAPREQASFDFEAIYEAFPGSKGKAKGIESLERQVKSQALYVVVLAAAKAYAAEEAAFKASGSKEFRPQVPYFSTWVNERRWEDTKTSATLPGISTVSPALERIREREAQERGYASHAERLVAEGRA
jgi:hypothetical protein